jgi:hypothetical protein
MPVPAIEHNLQRRGDLNLVIADAAGLECGRTWPMASTYVRNEVAFTRR